MPLHPIAAALTPDQVAGRLLLDVAIVIAVARLCGLLLRALRQPPVLGEIIGGILLGPSVLGALPGNPSADLFPPEVRAGLTAIGSIGLVLFMFIVGLELDLGKVRRASCPRRPSPPAPAGPCGARRSSRRSRAPRRRCALHARGPDPLVRVVLETVAFAAVLVLVVRPLLKLAVRRLSPDGELSVSAVAIAVVGLAACAGATQLIGLHSVLGAFAFGVAFPRRENPRFIERVSRALRPATTSILLPIFFLAPGLNVDLAGLDSHAPVELLLIFACASLGKLLGTTLGARAARVRGNDSHRLAALMNTRGLIELIVLNVGLSAGVLDRQLFSELVVMAVVTTMMAGPLLDLIDRRAAKARTAGIDELAVADPRAA